MTLWHIIRFTTIRHLWLTTITPGKGQRRTKPDYDKWVAVKQRNAVAWDPNRLHQFLKGEHDATHSATKLLHSVV